MRQMIRFIYTEVNDQLGIEAARAVMAELLFHRYICPALLNPHFSGLLEHAPHPKASEQLKLMAKVLSYLADGIRPSTLKEKANMERMDKFVDKNLVPLYGFYERVCDHADEGPSANANVPRAAVLNSLIDVHKFATDYWKEYLEDALNQHNSQLANELEEIVDDLGHVPHRDDDSWH